MKWFSPSPGSGNPQTSSSQRTATTMYVFPFSLPSKTPLLVPVELLSLLPFLLQLLTPLLSPPSSPPTTSRPTSPPRPTTHHHHHLLPFGLPLSFPSYAYGSYEAGFPLFPDYQFPPRPSFSGRCFRQGLGFQFFSRFRLPLPHPIWLLWFSFGLQEVSKPSSNCCVLAQAQNKDRMNSEQRCQCQFQAFFFPCKHLGCFYKQLKWCCTLLGQYIFDHFLESSLFGRCVYLSGKCQCISNCT